MKKLLSLTLAVMLVGVFAGSVLASEGGIAYTRGPDARIKVEVISGYATARAASTIAAGDLILGFTVTGSAATGGGLYDTTTAAAVTNSATGVFGEAYCSAGGSTTIMFPTPYTLTNNLYAIMPTTGVIVVYYEDR